LTKWWCSENGFVMCHLFKKIYPILYNRWKAWGSILEGPMPLNHHRLMLGPSFHCKNNPSSSSPPPDLHKTLPLWIGSSWQRSNNSALPPSPPPITSSHHRWWGRRRQRWLNSSYIISSCVVLPPWPWVCVYTHHGTCKKKLLMFFRGWGVGNDKPIPK